MDLPLGPLADVLIWDGYGPSRTRGDFFHFEVGGHGGTYEGWIHVIVPFIGRKNGTLTARQPSYNDVHGWYRARIEHLFEQLWHWGLVNPPCQCPPPPHLVATPPGMKNHPPPSMPPLSGTKNLGPLKGFLLKNPMFWTYKIILVMKRKNIMDGSACGFV